MTKKTQSRKARAAIEAAPGAERPRAGGSYIRDRATGALTRVPHPKAEPAVELDAEPGGQEPEAGEQGQSNPQNEMEA